FGPLFEAMHGLVGVHRPTLGLVSRWWSDALGHRRVREGLRRLLDLGVVQVVNPDAPRIEWALQVPGVIWDAVRGDLYERPAPWLRHRGRAELVGLDDVV